MSDEQDKKIKEDADKIIKLIRKANWSGVIIISGLLGYWAHPIVGGIALAIAIIIKFTDDKKENLKDLSKDKNN